MDYAFSVEMLILGHPELKTAVFTKCLYTFPSKITMPLIQKHTHYSTEKASLPND